MAQQAVDLANAQWMLSPDRNIALNQTSLVLNKGAGSDVEVIAHHSNGHFYVQHYGNPQALKAKNYSVRLPYWRAADRWPIAPADYDHYFVRVGPMKPNAAGRFTPATCDMMRPSKHTACIVEAVLGNDANKLLCDTYPLRYDPATRLLACRPQDEMIDLAKIAELKVGISYIWGQGKKAEYWVQLVKAETRERASQLDFYAPEVQLMAAFRHDRQTTPARRSKKLLDVVDEATIPHKKRKSAAVVVEATGTAPQQQQQCQALPSLV